MYINPVTWEAETKRILVKDQPDKKLRSPISTNKLGIEVSF
jgi:hypothetical protein